MVPAALVCALLSVLHAEEPINEKAQRYYDSLLKRPAPGPVFDRFYTAWLDSRTVEDLEAWLTQQADAPGAPSAARLLLAYFHMRQGDNPKAIAAFRAATAADPANAEAWYQQALAESRTLDFDGALASLDKAAAATPPAAVLGRIRQLKGRLLARAGRSADAAKVWQELIAADPDDEDLREDLVELQLAEGLTDEALATAEGLLARTTDPYRKIQRRLRIADIHQRAGNREKAVASCLACLDDTGADSWLEKEILTQLEQAFRRDDALDALRTEYERLAAANPQRVGLRRRYAALLVETGAVDQAVKEFTDILQRTPGNREIREAFIDLLLQAKRTDEAAAQMLELIRLHPEDLELVVKLAELHAAAGRRTEASAAVDDFLRRSDQSEAAWLRAAGLLERFQLAEASLDLHRRTAAKFPDSETAADALAVALHRSGSKDEAFDVWRRLADSPDKNRVMSVARSAAAREEHAFACDLLVSRLEPFRNDPLYLLLLCETAERVDREAEAVPWARTLVGLARDPVDLEATMTLLIRLAEKADRIETLLADLKAAAATPQEKCLLAELLDRSGDPQGAEALLKQIEADAPELATAVLVRLQTQRGDLAGAAASMKRLVEGPDGRRSVNVQRLVELFERAGKLADALTWIPEWKKLSPGSPAPWQKEAALQLSLGNSKEALRALRQASQEFDDNEDLKAMLAESFRNEGKFADASRLYTVLYEEAKDLTAKLRWVGALAQTAQDAGKLADLVEQFEERRKANRSSLLPLLSLAEIHRVAENQEARTAALAEASRLKAGDLDLLLEIARIAETEGDFPRALETLREAEPLDKSTKVKQRIARIHFAAGDEEKGMAALRQLADTGALDARQLEAMADALCDAELWKQAADFLAPRLKDFAGDYRLWYLHAVALEESDRPADAARAFRHLLTIREELPARSAAPAAAAAGSVRSSGIQPYLDSLRAYVSAEVLDFIRLQYSSYQAYQYKNANRNRFPSGGTGGAAPNLPPTVEEARSFAFIHLASLADAAEESLRAEIADGIRAGGIRAADLLLEIIQGTRIDRQIDFTERLAASPEDETLLSLAALWSSQQAGQEPDTLRAVYRGLHGKRPELAWLVGLRLIGAEDEESLRAFKETAEALEKLDVPPSLVLNGLSVLLQPEQQGTSIAEANRDAVNRLRSRLPAWFRKSDPKGYQAPWIFIQLAGMLSREDDLKPLVALLEDEVAAAKDDPQRASRQLFSQGGRQPLIESLTWPPQRLPDFSALVLALFNSRSENYFGGRIEWDADKLKAALPAAKDPVLRALLLARTDDQEALKALVADTKAREDAPLALCLMAASLAADQQSWADAGLLLRRAAAQPMARDLRRLVDGSFVRWAVEAGRGAPAAAGAAASAETADPLRTGGTEALLRLRREALNAQHRQELAEAMKDLGMEAEAERMAAASRQATNPGASAMPATSSIRMLGSGGGGRIDQLVEKGRRDEALRDLTRDFKSMARTWASGGSDALRYQAREWVDTVNRHGFEPALLAAMDPGTSESPDAIAAFGAALDILGEPRRAIALYQKALEKRPQDAAFRKCLVMAAVADDPDNAVSLLASVPPEQLLALAPSLAGILGQIETHSGRLAILELLVAALEKTEEAAARKLPLDLLFSALESAVQQSWANRDQLDLGSLYQEPPASWNGSDDDDAKRQRTALQTRRLELHTRACRWFLARPETARRAFQRFAGVALAAKDGPDVPAIDGMAAGVLELEKSRRGTAVRRPLTQNDRSDAKPLRMPEPEEWLLERAWEQKQPERITADLLPRLRAAKPQLARDFEELVPLYFCADAEFPAAAAEFIRKRQKASAPGMPRLHWRTVFHVADLRKLDADLSDLLVEGLRKDAGVNYGGAEHWHVMEHARRLLDTKGAEAVDRFFAAVAAVFLGPPDKREEHFRRHFNPNSWTSGSPNALIMQWLNVMRQCLQTPELVFPAAEAYVKEFQSPARSLGFEDQFFNYGNQLGDATLLRRGPDKLVAFLRRTPMVRPLETFAACAGPVRYQRCLAVDVLLTLANAGNDRQKFRDALAAEPRTFGTELLDAALSGSSTRDQLFAVVAKHLDAIRALPEPRRQDLAAMVKVIEARTGSAGNTAADSPAAGVLAWAEETLGGSTDALVAAFLDPKKDPNRRQRRGDHELDNQLQQIVPVLLKSRPEEGVKVFLAARRFVSEGRRAGLPSQIDYGDGSSVLGQSLGNLVSRPASHSNAPSPDDWLKLFRFAVEATADSEGFPVEWRDATIAALGQSLTAAASAAPEPAGDQKPATGQRKFSVRLLLPILTKAEADPLLLAGPLVAAFRQATTTDEDRKWLSEVAATDGPDTQAAGLAAAALRFAGAMSQSGTGPLPEAETAPLLSLLAPRLLDTTVPLSVRLGIVGSLMERRFGPPDLARSAAAVVAEAWQQDVPVSTRHAARLLGALSPDNTTAPFEEADRVVAEQCLRAWLKAAPRRATGRAAYGYRGPGGDDAQMTRTLFVIALRLGDDAALQQLLGAAGNLLDRAWFARLVYAGRDDLARRFVRAGNEALFGPVGEYEDAAWLPDGDERRAQFLAGFEAEDERFAAELLLASTPDTKRVTEGDLKGKVPLRAERLKALAERLPATFRNPLLAERTLGVLTEESSTAPALGRTLTDWAAGQTMGTLSQVQDSRTRARRARLYGLHLTARMEAGDLDLLCTTMEQLGANAASRQSGYLRETIRVLYPICDAAVPAAWKSADDAGRARLRKAWRAISIIEDNQSAFEAPLPRRLVRTMLQHAIDDRMTEFAAEVAAAPHRVRSALTKLMENQDVAADLKALGQSWTEMEKTAGIPRTALVLRLLDSGLGWPGDAKARSDRWLRLLIEAGWLQRDELLAAADQLMEKHPRRGLTAMELGTIMAEAGKPEAAALALEKAAAAMPADAPAATFRLSLVRAEVLGRSGRPAEGLALLGAIPEAVTTHASLTDPDRERLRSLKASLEQDIAFEKGGLAAALKPAAEAVKTKPDDIAAWRATAEALTGAAGVLSRRGEHAAALHSLSMAWLITRRTGTSDPAAANTAVQALAPRWQEAARAAGYDAAPRTIVPQDARWRTQPDGVVPTQADVVGAGYDDKSWPEVTLPAGWNAAGVQFTPVGAVPLRWFRLKFTATPAQVRSLTLDLQRDDGAAVWLNGTEIFRQNMASDALTALKNTTAAELRMLRSTKLPADKPALISQENILVVALAQHPSGMNDGLLGFALRANEVEPWDLGRLIDRKATAEGLGEAWAQFPEEFRSMIMEE